MPKIGGGRVAAYEMLVVDSAIANLIRENKTFRITSAIQTGPEKGHATARRPHVQALEDGARRKTRHPHQGPVATTICSTGSLRPSAECSRTRTKHANGKTTRSNHGDSAHRSDSGGPRFSPRRATGDAAGGAGPAARRDARADRHEHGADHRRPIGPGLGRADGHAGGQPQRRGDSARRADAHHRADGPALPHHSAELRGQHADHRHVRSAEAVDHRRVAEFPRFRHQGDGLHREGDAQGARSLLLGGRRERRDADRRHGAGQRVGGRGRRRWRRAPPWT